MPCSSAPIFSAFVFYFVFFFTLLPLSSSFFFFFNDTATTEIYTLSLHDALPISTSSLDCADGVEKSSALTVTSSFTSAISRSEEHTSELQSHLNLVCRLLLEKKKKKKIKQIAI